MSATVGPKIETEVDDTVRRDDALFKAAQAASTYFADRVRDAHLPELAAVHLGWGPLIDDGRILVTLKGEWEFSSREVSVERSMPQREITDPFDRKLWVWRLWGDLLERSSILKLRNVDDRIRALQDSENTEGNDGQ